VPVGVSRPDAGGFFTTAAMRVSLRVCLGWIRGNRLEESRDLNAGYARERSAARLADLGVSDSGVNQETVLGLVFVVAINYLIRAILLK